MVKFGGHVEAIRDGELLNAQLYLVPYNKMKLLIDEHSDKKTASDALPTQVMLDFKDFFLNEGEQKQAEEDLYATGIFVNIWKSALKQAEDDFRKARALVWQNIFATITAHLDIDDPVVRGAHPGNAIKAYVDVSISKANNDANDLLARMKEIHRAAWVNSEALRKLVKKSDKHQHQEQLSSTLLPLLYTSLLYSGQNMILESIGLLRELISGEFDEEEDAEQTLVRPQPLTTMIRRDSEVRHQQSVDIRMMEVNWLKSLVQNFPSNGLLSKLVSHRGFHNIKDRNDKRPVENSLSAYEMAWTCGIELCECDIALTKDEKLVLAHDEDFARLSLDANAANSKRKISELTFKEIISMPLTNGVRPPLLIDVLRSASAISEKSKLIIEIKPGNESSAFALARLLIRHPELRSSVAMIMSFDAQTMHHLREELERALLPDLLDSTEGDHGMPLQMHRRRTSFDHFSNMSTNWLGGMGITHRKSSSFQSTRKLSIGDSSIGLSISEANLKGSPSIENVNTVKESETLTDGEPKKTLREQYNMPKLMLLTVADSPNIACELQVKHNELYRVDNWLTKDDRSLDGVYLQFEKEMMTHEGAACLRELSKRFIVGIWQYARRDPDDFETFRWLVEEGNCSFVNTDLPKSFRGERMIQIDRLPPLH